MIRNVGTIDKVIRIVLALAIFALFGLKIIGGTLAIVLAAVAVILVLTSFISFCPIYFPFKISTRKRG